VLACAVAVLVIYGIVSSLVTDDAVLTRRGRIREVHFILRDVRDLDRQADLGPGPVTWIVGSSITRESFDAEAIQERMQAAGSEHRVVKFAFNRGAPIFTQALVDDLPLRPGDRVVTSIAEGNFYWGWLEEVAEFDLYAQAMLGPHELLALRDVSLPTRLEWSLGSTPPAAFYRNQISFRRGLVRTLNYWLGMRKKPRIKRNVSYQPFTDTTNTLRSNNSQDWSLPPDKVALRPGQTNHDALQWLADDVHARGAELTVVYVPGHPRLYQEFVQDSTVDAFHAHFDAWEALDFVRLRPRAHEAYMDWKHPNNRGRPGFSQDLADVLLRREGLTPPPAQPDPWIAERDAVPGRLWDEVEP